ncbi:uncharacterized protein LOC131041820 isoform X2 [Cryptomeria japonica]|uniref:uncharacterized protein LOC131041820 isoform X2 n=1 Tax=Cryptomeria japonica TaxID=3369 RepID=UPI0025ABFB02|nr:uncharacterized protein LOC131041820 isoform X2 [Cryptomeria japonica]
MTTTLSRCFQSISKIRHINKVAYCYRQISFIPDSHCQKNKSVNDLPGDAKKWGSLGFGRGAKFATGYSALVPKSLESIIDLERAKNIPPEELSAVWNEYHIGRGHISTVLTSKQYYLLAQRTSSCVYFVIPLWKGAGYTSMFVQAKMPHMIFTGLEDYKARGPQASPYITVTYYKEFAESKGLVLVRGDVVFTSKLSDEEASFLKICTHFI